MPWKIFRPFHLLRYFQFFSLFSSFQSSIHFSAMQRCWTMARFNLQTQETAWRDTRMRSIKSKRVKRTILATFERATTKPFNCLTKLFTRRLLLLVCRWFRTSIWSFEFDKNIFSWHTSMSILLRWTFNHDRKDSKRLLTLDMTLSWMQSCSECATMTHSLPINIAPRWTSKGFFLPFCFASSYPDFHMKFDLYHLLHLFRQISFNSIEQATRKTDNDAT